MFGNYGHSTIPLTIMVLFVGQLAAMCQKSKHLKHFLFEVLVGDLRVEVEGFSLETIWWEVISFKKLEG